MNENLYQPPSSQITAPSWSGEGTIPAAAITHLTGTQPWARLTGIILLTCVIVYVGIMFYIFSMMNRYSDAVGPAFLMIAGISYLFIHPLVRLCKYGSAINRLRITQSQTDFEEALRQQRLFWRFVGVLFLVFLILVGIGIMINLSRSSPRF